MDGDDGGLMLYFICLFMSENMSLCACRGACDFSFDDVIFCT